MKSMLTAVGVMAAVAGTAAAQPAIFSFTYSDLLGSFDSNTGAYSVVAGAETSGDVTRLDGAPGTAEYIAGDLPGAFADFQIAMTVSNIGASTADGAGSLVITDNNGDQLLADINGHFVSLFGSIFFEGELLNAAFVNNSGDGTFDGTSGGSFSTLLAPTSDLNGALVEIFFNPGNFFNTSFSDRITLASGLLVPAPGSAALAVLGGVVASRRRRA